jgi:hypothetical protein
MSLDRHQRKGLTLFPSNLEMILVQMTGNGDKPMLGALEN